MQSGPEARMRLLVHSPELYETEREVVAPQLAP